MKKKILFALLLLSMFIAPVFAEESSFQFLNEFDLRTNYWEEINFTKTEKTADGNYVVSQGSYIKLVKPSGRTIWSQELSEITGNDRVDFYIEDEYVYVTYTSFGNVHVVIYELSTGEYVDDYFGSGGFFIDKIGDNFIVADWEGIYLYDENWNSINASINTNLFSSKSIFVEDNKVYTLSCQAAGRSTSTLCTPYLVIYNENLEVESSKKVVGDEFNNVDAFFKVNNDFYITHFNVYKIASNGSSTMVIDAEENGTDYLSGAKVDNYIVLGGMENKCVPDKGTKNSCQDKLLLSVYDTDFNYLEDLAPLEDNEDTSGIVKNITPHEFLENYIGMELDEYVSIIHSPTADKPFNDTYTVKYLGNVIEGNKVKYLNLEMSRLKELVISQLKDGESVWFGSDCSKDADRKEGIWDDLSFDIDRLFQINTSMPKEAMLDTWDSAMNHAMVITGVNIEDGKFSYGYVVPKALKV